MHSLGHGCQNNTIFFYMKSLLLSFLLFLINCILVFPQTSELWSTTLSGGNNNFGTVFKIHPDGSGYALTHEFSSVHPGSWPKGKVIEGTNGKLYGVTERSGSYNSGVLFSFDTLTNVYSRIANFGHDSLGMYPSGELLLASNGLMYGLTASGGIYNSGTLYCFDPISQNIRTLTNFNGASTGAMPRGGLIQASNGLLYGVSSNGGSQNKGVLFQFDLASDSLAVVANFGLAPNSEYPFNTLVQALNGKLYGLSIGGGSQNNGTIFEFDITNNLLQKKIDLTYALGTLPEGSLTSTSNGILYGMTTRGGTNNFGVLFSYDPVNNIYQKILNMNASSNGSRPFGSLFLASNGLLYGATSNDGTAYSPTFFSYDPATNTFTLLRQLLASYGIVKPAGSFIQTSTGKLYGISLESENGNGTLFRYSIDQDSLEEVFVFNDRENGMNPASDLVLATDGNLYGMTQGGGIFDAGIIYRLNPLSNSFAKIHDFDGGTNGAFPEGKLMQASDGKLYGLTKYGGNAFGNDGNGVCFSYDLNTNLFQTLFLLGDSIGKSPEGELIQASDGKIYGLAFFGGAFNSGTLFCYDPVSQINSKLLDFDAPSYGANPNGSLIQGLDGKLYGLTSTNNSSTNSPVFSYDYVNHIYTSIPGFTQSTSGSIPLGDLIQTSNGNLYGLTVEGGTNNRGIIFSFDFNSSTFSNLHNFDVPTGSYTRGSLLECSNGILYGMTGENGSSLNGVIFSFDPVNNVYQVIKALNLPEGTQPWNSSFLEIQSTSSIDSQTLNAERFFVFPNPAKDQINVVCPVGADHLDISDLFGKIIFQSSGNDSKLTIPIKRSGIYIFRVLLKGKEIRKKIIVLN